MLVQSMGVPAFSSKRVRRIDRRIAERMEAFSRDVEVALVHHDPATGAARRSHRFR
jgi:hypothetical protein